MSMNRDKLVSGQLFFRESREEAPDGSDRKLMMVVGIIAVPRDCDLKGEHQYVIAGGKDLINEKLALLVHPEGKDLTEEARGEALTGLLRSPIWRC